MLPGEEDYTAQINRELSAELQIWYSFKVTCVEIVTERHSTKPLTHYPIAYRVGHSLCVKAIKHFRSTLALTEIGAIQDVNILGRVLFETFTALSFVLYTSVNLKFGSSDYSNYDPDKRATLYTAFHSINRYNELQKHLQDSRLSLPLPQSKIDAIKSEHDLASVGVGIEWTEQFTKSKSYSGVSLRDLAERISPDHVKWYDTIYGQQSKSVHAKDMADHFEYSDCRSSHSICGRASDTPLQSQRWSNRLQRWRLDRERSLHRPRAPRPNGCLFREIPGNCVCRENNPRRQCERRRGR